MNNHTDDPMVEAMRLTRAGKLAEATALIQQNLGHSQAPQRTTATHVVSPSLAQVLPGIRKLQGGLASMPSLPKSLAALKPGVLPGRTGRGGARRPVSVEAVAPAAGKWIDGTLTNAAGTRAYKLYVPSGYQGKPAPLVVMLHGCTQHPDDFAAGTRMNFLAEGDGFLVVYPAQADTANASRCWNWFQSADQQRDQGEPLLIAAITRQVMVDYQVDARRVYVAGLSAGGAMAAIMATTYPDLYAALGVHSGLAPGSAHDLPSAFQAMQHGASANAPRGGHDTPLILFHGDGDATVHPSNADHLARHWAAAAGAAPTLTVHRSQKLGGREATCAVHHTANRQSLVEQWTVHGAGHAWSGGSPSGSHTDPEGPDASREIVRFFREHPLPEQPTRRAR